MTLENLRNSALQQLSIPGLETSTAMFHALSEPRSIDERGAIFTRRTVVD